MFCLLQNTKEPFYLSMFFYLSKENQRNVLSFPQSRSKLSGKNQHWCILQSVKGDICCVVFLDITFSLCCEKRALV